MYRIIPILTMESASETESNFSPAQIPNTLSSTKPKKKKKKKKKKKGVLARENEPEEPLPLSGLEEILGYKFHEPKLLEEAMTHASSPSSCVNYDRLEFVGDAVINWLMAKELFTMYPDVAQGTLTRLRALNVDTEKFARVTINYGLYQYLRHNEVTFEKQIQVFKDEIHNYPVHSNGLNEPPKFLADILESTAGAVLIDSNYNLDIVWKAFKGLLEPLIRPEEVRDHPMTELQERCQEKGVPFKFIDSWDENGAISVIVNDRLAGSGYASKKETAQNRAAKDALDKLESFLV